MLLSTRPEICPVLLSDYWRRKNQGKGGTRKWETPLKNFGVGLTSFLPSFLKVMVSGISESIRMIPNTTAKTEL